MVYNSVVVTKLPLFPLPETVLFPGMALPLHIFEERYKQMIRDCMNNDISRIVIVLSKTQMEQYNEEKFSEGAFENTDVQNLTEDGKNILDAEVDVSTRDTVNPESHSLDETLQDVLTKLSPDDFFSDDVFEEETAFIYEVGAYLDIMQISENSDGSFDILGHGGDRCKVENVDEGEHVYLSVEDKPLPIERSDLNIERLRAWDAVELFKRYAEVIYPADVQQQIDEAMPDDINLQASFICANLSVDSGTRQELLEASSLLDRFTLAQAIMKSELRKIKRKSNSVIDAIEPADPIDQTDTVEDIQIDESD